MEKSQPVKLYFEEIGQGLPVIFLHGFPFNHTIWSPVVEKMKDEVQIILPDLRGHGQSPVTEGVYTMRLMAEDIIALMDSLSVERAVLVGHSMGGYIALNLAGAYPARLAGLALVASHSAADTPERKMARLNTAREVLKHGVYKYADVNASKMTNKPELVSYIYEMMMKTSPIAVAAALNGMAERQDSMDILSRVTVPALIMVGGADSHISLELATTMEKLLTRGWLVKIPDAAHVPMLENPEAVADNLLQLIKAVKSS
jgi:3-oxoadipate enol-lactonase